MNVLEFARNYDKIICKNPYIPILYHIAKPYEANRLVEQILYDSEHEVHFSNEGQIRLMRIDSISNEYYPVKCTSFNSNRGSKSIGFRQLTDTHREYDYFYGVCYDETSMYVTLIPTNENKLKLLGIEWGMSNHRGSDGLNVDINKTQLMNLCHEYGYIKINHKDISENEIKL
ncbi:MAG: hypothetical protein ACRCX2_04340 [Paraclostridium sp.]